MTDRTPAPRSPWWTRPELLGACGVGALAFLLMLARTWHEPAWSTDFDQWYHAARAMWEGGSPYDAVGPTRAFRWDWPLNYPLPTILLTLPFTVVPVVVARILFATAGGAVLGYALGRDHFRRLGLLASAAFLIAIFRNQWSPFITASFFVPLAAVFLAAKPNMAVPFVAGAPNWRQLRWIVGLGGLVAVASLIVRPRWPLEWLGALGQMRYVVSPIMRPAGFLYALALLRWRRPEARVFLALTCVPQTPSLYDLLPLFVVSRTRREVALLALLTHLLFLAIVVIGPFDTFEHYAYRLGYLSTFLVYLPALAMVLRRRNVFADPEPVTLAPEGVEEPHETAPSQGMRVRVRAYIESLSRLDAMLLLVNVSATVLLAWFALVTRRA